MFEIVGAAFPAPTETRISPLRPAYARKTDAETAAHETDTAAVDWNTVLDKAR